MRLTGVPDDVCFLDEIAPQRLQAVLGLAFAPIGCHVIGMCGRYTHKLTWQQIVNLYRLTLPEEEPSGLRQSYNVAPTDVMPIIRPAGNGRELAMAGWGLIPYWLKPEDLAKKPFSTI
jgi:hypothetical protein